jgi:DNA-binding transcriptional LysR family regulator
MNDEMVDLVSAGFDLAVRIGNLTDSSLVARRLASNRRILCAAPDYVRRQGMPRTVAELERHECLILVGGQGREDVWRLADAGGNESSVRVQGRLESNLGEALRDAALAGLGIALHSTWHIDEDLRAGRLVRVLPEYALSNAIHAVMPQRRLVPPRVRAFVDFLAERFDTPFWRGE